MTQAADGKRGSAGRGFGAGGRRRGAGGRCGTAAGCGRNRHHHNHRSCDSPPYHFGCPDRSRPPWPLVLCGRFTRNLSIHACRTSKGKVRAMLGRSRPSSQWSQGRYFLRSVGELRRVIGWRVRTPDSSRENEMKRTMGEEMTASAGAAAVVPEAAKRRRRGADGRHAAGRAAGAQTPGELPFWLIVVSRGRAGTRRSPPAARAASSARPKSNRNRMPRHPPSVREDQKHHPERTVSSAPTAPAEPSPRWPTQVSSTTLRTRD